MMGVSSSEREQVMRGSREGFADALKCNTALMRKRIRKIRRQIRKAGGVDIVVTHAPPHGLGDDADPAHWGFESLLELLDKYHPQYLIHGHVHLNYNYMGSASRSLSYGDTTIINAFERYTLEIPDREYPLQQKGQVIYKTRLKERNDYF